MGGGPSGIMSPSVFSSRPLSGKGGALSNKVLKSEKSKLPPKKPISIIDEYNKKIVEGGADR
jgi:hypothetical protein